MVLELVLVAVMLVTSLMYHGILVGIHGWFSLQKWRYDEHRMTYSMYVYVCVWMDVYVCMYAWMSVCLSACLLCIYIIICKTNNVVYVVWSSVAAWDSGMWSSRPQKVSKELGIPMAPQGS